jgi:predicted patatin/cPLA2 family phospholipase
MKGDTRDRRPGKTALVMEGGAMRGMFTCGVIDVLMENGVTFDGAAGISAGAAFGCNIKSNQPGRPIRYNKKYCGDPRYCSLRSLLTTGDLYGADFCYRELPYILDPFDSRAFAENPMEFHVGATCAETGECEYHRCTDGGEEDFLWFRASASMPVVSRPVRIGGKTYLDGGITDAVPYAYMREQGYDRQVIALTQPKGYRKAEIPAAAKPLLGFLLRKLPRIREAMLRRPGMYNRQMDELDRMEAEKSALVIRPPESLRIGHTEKNPDELERVYRIGRAEAEKRLPEIRQWLGRV